MATVTKWTPFGVALDVTATGSNVVRTSATQFTVNISVAWETYYNGAQTNYGMTATSGGVTHTISPFNGTKRSSGSGSFKGTYSISGNGSATKTITVAFKNFNTDNGDSASKNVTFNVTVPAWTSYTVQYNANGGSGAPGKQTKWKDQNLTLSSTKPTRTGYSFQGWALTKADADNSKWYYQPGGSCGRNENLTLYAVWKANTYAVNYNANGGTGAPAAQTKTYGVTLTLSNTKPTRTNYNFLGWGTSASATTVAYNAGAGYTTNSAITLYAVWELAYVKPRITNVSVTRCKEVEGVYNPSDDGTVAHITFNWASDRNVTSIDISLEGSDGSMLTTKPDASGTSGTVDVYVNSLGSEMTYTVKMVVTDSVDHSSSVMTLTGSIFAIDFLPENKGVAFNKPAELEGVMDVGFQTYLRGGLKYCVLENGTNIDGVLTPGFYVGSHTYEYVNCPVAAGSSFTLEVMSSGDIGQLIQRMTTCDMSRHVTHERSYYESYWGEWMKTSPTVIYEEMFYTPSAAETFELVGSITIPKRTAFTLTARGQWQNSRCHGVIISDRQSTDNGNHPYSYSVAACFNEDDRVFFPSCTYSGNTGVESVTFYIWGKWQATNLNKVEVTGFYMPY